jgi:hypothetical protein
VTLQRLLPHQPIPALAELRNQVLQIDRKRKPKWRLRLAPDLILQLQPWDERQRLFPVERFAEIARLDGAERRAFVDAITADYVLLFKGEAILGRDDVTSFDRIPETSAAWARLLFYLYARPATGAWFIKLHGGRASGGARLEPNLDRLRGELRPERFATFTPELMLSPACLLCGKGLTDPASMARWIGPECAGTGSLNVPRVYQPERQEVTV